MAEEPVCSFCGKNQSAVRKLIAGGGHQVVAARRQGERITRALPLVYICDDCVGRCVEVLENEAPEGPA